MSNSVVLSFVSGSATADEIAEVEAHLAGCGDCRDLVAHLAELSAGDAQALAADTVLDARAPAAQSSTRVATTSARQPGAAVYRWRWPLACVLVLAAIGSGAVAGHRRQVARAAAISGALADARAALAANDSARALAAATTALERARQADAFAAAADARCIESAGRLLAHDHDGALAAANDAVTLAHRAADPTRAVDAALALALVQGQRASLDDAAATLRAARAAAAALHDARREALAARGLDAIEHHRGQATTVK